jgi:hypothetical protein
VQLRQSQFSHRTHQQIDITDKFVATMNFLPLSFAWAMITIYRSTATLQQLPGLLDPGHRSWPNCAIGTLLFPFWLHLMPLINPGTVETVITDPDGFLARLARDPSYLETSLPVLKKENLRVAILVCLLIQAGLIKDPLILMKTIITGNPTCFNGIVPARMVRR